MNIQYEDLSNGQVRATLFLKKVAGESVRSYAVFAGDREESGNQLLAWMKDEGKNPQDFE